MHSLWRANSYLLPYLFLFASKCSGQASYEPLSKFLIICKVSSDAPVGGADNDGYMHMIVTCTCTELSA